MINSSPVLDRKQVVVQKDPSGGVRILFGGHGFVLSPKDAIQLGVGILNAAGCTLTFNDGPARAEVES